MSTKKIITTFLMSMLLFGLTWLKKNNHLKPELSLSNIEALASNESGDNVMCFGLGTVDCPKDHTKVVMIYEF